MDINRLWKATHLAALQAANDENLLHLSQEIYATLPTIRDLYAIENINNCDVRISSELRERGYSWNDENKVWEKR
jgi:hypothetical protein